MELHQLGTVFCHSRPLPKVGVVLRKPKALTNDMHIRWFLLYSLHQAKPQTVSNRFNQLGSFPWKVFALAKRQIRMMGVYEDLKHFTLLLLPETDHTIAPPLPFKPSVFFHEGLHGVVEKTLVTRSYKKQLTGPFSARCEMPSDVVVMALLSLSDWEMF